MSLTQGLLLPLLAGLLAYSLVHLMACAMGGRVKGQVSKYLAATVLSVIVVGSLTAAGWWLIDFFYSDPSRIHGVQQKLIDVLASAQPHIPEWLWKRMPHTVEELNQLIVKVAVDNMFMAKTLGTEVGVVVLDFILGMVIGALIAMTETSQQNVLLARPLAHEFFVRAKNLAVAFKTIVFAQVRISAINAFVTFLFLFVVLPLCGVELPFRKTLVVLAFIFGIMPVIGNTISNFILIFIGLSHSLPVALGAFTFMFIVHKFEYFLNAKIMGHSIQSNTWEILFAMVVMKQLFGLPGLIAAPIFYAYIMSELRQKELI